MHFWIKKLLPRSFYGRALLIIVSPLVLLQLISAWVFYDRHWNDVTWRLASALAGEIGFIIHELSDNPDEQKKIFKNAHSRMGIDILLIPAEILENKEKKTDGFSAALLGQALDERLARPWNIDTSSVRKKIVIDVQLADAVLRVTISRSRLFSSSSYIFIMWMVGSSLVLFAIASVFMRNQVRPIRRLAHMVDGFGKGREMDNALKPEGALEIRQVTTAFNLMAERVRRQIRQRTDMLSAVSHDLRTPMTRVKLQLAMLREEKESAELGKNISEMEVMIEDYLTFARGEGGERSVQSDLSALVRDIAEKWRVGGTAVDCHVEGKITLWIKPRALRRCIDNLMANANRYGRYIWLYAGCRGDMVNIMVDDDGPGIPEGQREEAFRPFYRLEQSRNPTTGGSGLGLAISRDVARVHGGDVLLENSPRGGLRARIRLPI